MAHRARAIRILLAGSMIAVALPASAQEGMFFQNAMRTFGLMPGEGPDIEYRQRPPLVVPPSSALPRPQDPASQRTAAWPNDPDVAARRADAKDALIPATEREKYKLNQTPLLSQQELRRGRVNASGQPQMPPETQSKTFEENIGPIRAGRELAARQAATDTSNLVHGQEPQRRLLSDPPTGYRKPAGTAPLGPGRAGPREDSNSTGQKEFVQGLPSPTTP